MTIAFLGAEAQNGYTYLNQLTKGGFWSNLDATPPVINRMRDRVFVGNAALMHDNRAATNNTWIPNNSAGANWAMRDSQFLVMQDRGGMAVTGMSQVIDGESDVNPAPTIGVSGFVINNGSRGLSSWGLYSDVQHEPGAPAQSYGLEVAAKNKALDYTSTPYSMTYGVYGLWLAGGGDDTYGGAHTNPNNTALAVVSNSSTWNKGIVFAADALTGSDGVTGTATAIQMARGHTISWLQSGGNAGATIRSNVNIGNREVSMIFDNNEIDYFGSGGATLFKMLHQASAVNYLAVKNSATGNAIDIGAFGTDSNIDLSLTTKGSGVVRFGSYTAIGSETLAGYVTIKDIANNVRKVAIVN